MNSRLVIGAVAALALLAGCAPQPPVPTTLATAGPATAASGPESTGVQPGPNVAPPAGPFTPVAMPWSDGGPALWPLPWESGAESEDGWGRSLTRYGFLDASAREAVPPRYLNFEYCMDGGRPLRVVAAREGAVDVIDFDGTVTATIKTGASADQASWQSLWCRDNKILVIDTGADWDRYDLSSGAKLAPEPFNNDDRCEDRGQEPDLPAEYPTDAYGGWASNDNDLNRDATAYLNLETKAVVKPGPEYWYCVGNSGYLNCTGRLFTGVYDKFGKLTDFALVQDRNIGGCNYPRVADTPYLWAVDGSVEGYIDRTGAWHYQTSLYSNANDA